MSIDRIKASLGRLDAMQQAVSETAVDMQAERGRFERIAGSEPTKAISSHNLFQTPPALARHMAGMLGTVAGRVLEPSAGLGRLAKEIDADEVVLVEQSPDCCAELYGLGHKLFQRDFLQCTASDLGGLFDAVLMNPPFKMGSDIKHILHAHRMLKPGGVLIGLCYNGAKQNKVLRPQVESWKVLPEGTFKDEGTRASVALVQMTGA